MMKKILKKTAACVMMAIMMISAFWSTGAVTADGATDLKLVADAAYVYCATTGETIYDYNSQAVYDPASVSKLMTCLLAVEKLNLDDKAECNGEMVSIEELLYRALLASDNEAAAALGVAVSGSREEFIILMNERAREIGCEHTEFKNASGLYFYNTSCARDMALIAEEALSNETVRKISGTAHYDLTGSKYNDAAHIDNTNLFLDGGSLKTTTNKTFTYDAYPGVFGGKTGTSSDNHTAMVVGCDFDGLECYCVILHSTYDYRYDDMLKLLRFTAENTCSYAAFVKGDTFTPGKVWGGAVNTVVGSAAQDGVINLPEGASPALVTAEAVYKEKLQAPVKEGQKIGQINISMAGEFIRSVDLVASQKVSKGWFLSRFRITNVQTLIIFGVLFLLLLLFILVLVLRKANRKREAMQRRERLMKLARQQMMNEQNSRNRGWPY